MKNTLIVTSYVLLVALFFGGGYAVGKRNGAVGYEVPVVSEPQVVDADAGNVIESPVYEVICEAGELKIYKCIGDMKELITHEEISESVFPKEDIEELRRGVKFERLEGAQQMFENFVS